MAGAAETNQLPEGLRAASGAGTAHGLQPEARHDAADQLPVAMLAD
jgi:hypothetical protein